MTQDIWVTLSLEEQRYLKYIGAKKKRLDDLNAQVKELYSDIQNGRDLLLLSALDRLKAEGFKENVDVIYQPTKTVHVIQGLWLDNDCDMMAINLLPPPKLKFGHISYVHECEVVKSKNKK